MEAARKKPTRRSDKVGVSDWSVDHISISHFTPSGKVSDDSFLALKWFIFIANVHVYLFVCFVLQSVLLVNFIDAYVMRCSLEQQIQSK